jgi:hypothetical protein
MSSKIIKMMSVATIITVGFFSVTANADGIDLPEAYTSVVAITSALASSAGDLMQFDRTTQRLKKIRTALASKLVGANFGDRFSINDLIDEQDLLCGARASHIASISRYNYLNGVTSKIQEVSKQTNPTDIVSAIKALFASYSVNVSDKTLSATAINELKNLVITRCQTDIRGFDQAYYGIAIRPAAPVGPAETLTQPEALPSFGFLGPFGVLIDTVIGIITPVAVETATIVDQAKRRKAIEDFLSDRDNRTSLENAGHELAQAVSDYTWTKRLKSAGSFVEGVAEIRAAEIDLAKLDACKDSNNEKFIRSASGAPSARFMLCWRAAWGRLASIVAATLKAGEEYDELADAGDSATALKSFDKLKTELQAIGGGNPLGDPQAFWQSILRLVSFANTLQTAFSQDNRDKIRKAIDGLVQTP